MPQHTGVPHDSLRCAAKILLWTLENTPKLNYISINEINPFNIIVSAQERVDPTVAVAKLYTGIKDTKAV